MISPEPDWRIRSATAADEAAVTGLLGACYPALLALSYDAAVLAVALPFMTRANPRLLASTTYYVAETRDGSLAACGGWSRERPGSGEVDTGLAHVRHFGTHPSFTRLGMAGAILRHCITEASAEGIEEMECYSTIAARAFYEAAGFTVIEEMHTRFSGAASLPALRMRRAIGPDSQ